MEYTEEKKNVWNSVSKEFRKHPTKKQRFLVKYGQRKNKRTRGIKKI
jgi:hypothetical protein